jgi:O-antigen/teichoic acid export membrane protein
MHKLLANYLYTFGYQVFLMILPVFTLPYISRALLPKGVGVNSWTYSISYYFVLLGVLGLTTYGQREVALWKHSRRRFRSTFWEIEIASIITTLISLIAYAVTIVILDRYQKYLLIYGISIFASLFDISWLFSGLEKFAILSFRNFIIKSLSVVTMFLFVKSPKDLGIYILIQVLTILISNISLWPPALRIVGHVQVRSLYFVFQRIKHSFSYFIPQISISLYVTLNKVLLGFLAGTIQTGYFDSSDKIARLLFSAFMAISTVMMPTISSMFSQKRYAEIRSMLSNVLFFSTLLILPISFLLAANSELIVSVILGPKYMPMVNVLRISSLILIPMSVANILGNQVLIPFNKIRTYTVSVMGGAIVNLVIDAPLILFYGANGAAMASFISEFTVMAFQIYFCKDVIPLHTMIQASGSQLVIGAVVMIPSIIVVMVMLHSNYALCVIVSIIIVVIYLLALTPWLLKRIRQTVLTR